ncbi:MAG: methylmalonyl-CoA mutase [Candidatus Methanofastidiosum methylothiophilum]|jgi:methylmalonyl-CoA mutase N-terminal domain/subunit|uniref:Methylmalonyl-CoA mutase n=1 Tax=Candidatus Methanofastidiosum methylothiophilum TaxID=1705564 RepID=A0A150JJR6_9EURY|nr:MAG: methylmalonyl-CoA mutase [Candidatus Methanofastidiosum methylthiophilus]MBP6932608.1 methylmalonyl-CoA mutase family protein [Methanofastidiosum sp.]OQC51977.1 MAG: methylmalonyl-CoA mutase [Euryarchaeota archaeon ADurb.Bin023]KYC57316.1 MAG: methylmalonyl-CoA mutase [Candidatus Methanofastidiosum methylthiophilus]KYC57493.1 MAG: methylmalonyl-CoA mutase [Candidatus Methanofastidiosum methylthiophilus]
MFDTIAITNLKEKIDIWKKEKYSKIRTKFPERREEFFTTSNIPVDVQYSPLDIMNLDYTKDLGNAGEYPFTRGVQPNMYRGKLWTMRQYAGFGSAEETNKRYKFLLSEGQTGLSVAFDLPTQIGYDSDNQISFGEVGKVGVAIDSLEDMESLFDGIPLDKVSTSMTINSTAAILLAMYMAVAEKQGIAPEKLRGTIQNDILKEYVARGTYIFPPKESMRIITDIFEYCTKNLPEWNTISISGYHIREAGATAAQEVAFTLADGVAYVEVAKKARLEIDDFGKRLSFFFNSHNNFIEEIAKFRAARRIWARLMKERFGATDPKAMMLRFHTQTSGSTLTAQQSENNIIRVTMQAMAAVFGGTQSLHTNSMDEALALPSEKAVTISLRTQQVIAYESGVADTVDPFAGSYYLEYLTNKIEEEVNNYFNKIDSLGGMVKAIEEGYIQKEIQDSAYKYQKAIEKKDIIVVGLNKFTMEEKLPEKLLKVDPEVEKIQIEKLKKLKSRRDNNEVKEILEKIEDAARSDKNLMPLILEAVKAYATIGEISDSLRNVFGEYKPSVLL